MLAMILITCHLSPQKCTKLSCNFLNPKHSKVWFHCIETSSKTPFLMVCTLKKLGEASGDESEIILNAAKPTAEGTYEVLRAFVIVAAIRSHCPLILNLLLFL